MPRPYGLEEVTPDDSETLLAFRRDGASSAVSAKVLKANPHVLVPWSTEIGLPTGEGQKLTMGRVCAHWYHSGDESAAATAMLKGEATYLPSHIQAALKTERQPSFPAGYKPTTKELITGKLDPERQADAQAEDQGGDQGDQGQHSESEESEEGEQEPVSSWRPVDLTSVLDGSWKPLEPSVGRWLDGMGLFYPGRTHTVVSETEGGKTWFALAAAILEMAAGCHVFYLDFEDDEGSVVGRLLNLGVDPEVIGDLFHYFRPEHPLEGRHLEALCEELAHYGPSLAMLDGITEAMTMHGLNPLDNVDIALFNRRVNLPMTASGAAQASFDHVVKDNQNRGRYAIGGVHKLNIVSGAGYILENKQPFGIGMTGRSNIKIAKDRPGQLRRHAVDSKWYADLVLVSDAEGKAEVAIESAQQRVEGGSQRNRSGRRTSWRRSPGTSKTRAPRIHRIRSSRTCQAIVTGRLRA